MVPVDLLSTLQDTWWTLCDTYDVCAECPDMQALFEGADFYMPAQASEMIVANMLSEVMECVGRFSPWYRQPATAYGLILIHDRETHCPCWVLSVEATQQWRELLKPLAMAIEKNIGLILATNLIGGMMQAVPADDPRIKARCFCLPPNIILVNRSVLHSARIVCDACRQPFQAIDKPSGPNSWIV